MRIAGLERRMMPVGKIRTGNQVVAKNGKKRPNVLEKFRLTSSNPVLLEHAARLYGGAVQAWTEAPAGPRQWELYVEVEAIPIIIPPMETIHQCYEVWSAKGCLRRCDGETIQGAQARAEVGQPCLCPADPEERQTLAADGQACKLTTRISCMLPDIPGIGLWVLETHSYYASLWTAGMVEFLESLAKHGRVCEALLRIERQTRKGKHGVRHFAIPTIIPQQMTPRQLFAQEMHLALHPGEPLRPDERQKALPEHIADLYGDDAVNVRTGEMTPALLHPIWATIADWYAQAGRPEQYAQYQQWACRRSRVQTIADIPESDLEDMAAKVYATLEPLIVGRHATREISDLPPASAAKAAKKDGEYVESSHGTETHLEDARGLQNDNGEDTGVLGASWGPERPDVFAEEEAAEHREEG